MRLNFDTLIIYMAYLVNYDIMIDCQPNILKLLYFFVMILILIRIPEQSLWSVPVNGRSRVILIVKTLT